MVDNDRLTEDDNAGKLAADPAGEMHASSIGTARLTSRSIRSFVIRNGRLTDAQADALQRLMPRYGLHYMEPAASPGACSSSTPEADTPLPLLDTSAVFGRTAPVWLEIGFGNGDALLAMAAAHPDIDFIGIEVHSPGVGHVLIGIEAAGLSNVRVMQHDAMEAMQFRLAPASLARVLLFFPDPWHKKRHHKRRIVQSEFLDAVAGVLQPGGVLHCATDWQDYATWMLEMIGADSRFRNQAGDGGISPRPDTRLLTRFEQRGQRLGHNVTDLLYTRVSD